MKKTRLLQIIREEITIALSEASYAGKNAIPDMKKDPAYNTLNQTGKIDAEKELKSGGTVELEEEQLDEMAFALKKGIAPNEKIEPRYKKENFKKVVDLILSKVDGKKTTSDIAKELGVIQQKINPVVSDLIIAGILEKGEAESKAGKNIFKGGRKANPNKPEKAPSTGQRGRPAGTKKATLTKGDDEDDELEKADKEYYSPEEEETPTEKAPVGDKGTEQKARKQDKIIKAYKEIESELKDKISKAKTGDKAAMDWLKEKQPIIKAYNALKTVKI